MPKQVVCPIGADDFDAFASKEAAQPCWMASSVAWGFKLPPGMCHLPPATYLPAPFNYG